METRIVITIKTEDMKNFSFDDAGETVCVSQDVEEELHQSILDLIEEYLLADDFFDVWNNYVGDKPDTYEYVPTENADDFNDYCTMSIRIEREEK